MAYAPDVDNPLPKPKPKPKGGGNNGGGGANRLVIPAFDPGQLSALAEQLNAGFGGGVGSWKDNLRQTTAPSVLDLSGIGGGGKGHGKGGGKNDPTKPGTGGDDGGFEPSRPRNARAAPMAMPYGVMAGLQPGAGVMSGIPMMQQAPARPQMTIPQSGVLALLRSQRGI